MGSSSEAGPRAPFIMPDGRSFASFLGADEPVVRSKRGKRVSTSGSRFDAGWVSAGGLPSTTLDALDKVGRRRANRWLNNRLLVAMAGRLTATDMEGLFKPVPFGTEPQPSAWEMLSAPEHLMLCELLRSISIEDQARYLQYLSPSTERDEQPGSQAAQARAEAAWKRIPRRGRVALREADAAGLVAAIEDRILSHNVESNEELAFESLESYGRLLCHSLASYHGYKSSTVVRGDGSKAVILLSRGKLELNSPGLSCLMLLHSVRHQRPHATGHQISQQWVHDTPARLREVSVSA